MTVDALTVSVDYLITEVAGYTEAQLSIEPEHVTILGYCKEENGLLAEAAQDVKDRKVDLVVARAHRDRQQHKVRIAAGAFANQIVRIAGGNRKSDIYIGYFPNGYGVYGKLSLESQLEACRALTVRLDRETNEDVKAAGQEFRAVALAAEAALADWKAKAQALSDAKSRLYAARIRWRASNRKVAADLRSLHTDDPRYVASFFYAPARKRKNGLGLDGEDGEGAEGVDAGADSNGNGTLPSSTNGNGSVANGAGSDGAVATDGGQHGTFGDGAVVL
ncbi:MAG: hypothetical protein R3E97_03180 [Candidatus Eisenbacteria bacterium]